MPKMTVSVPDEVLKRFKKTCPDVNPAEVVRRGIIRKLKELEKLEALETLGVLGSKKFEEFFRKLKAKEVI